MSDMQMILVAVAVVAVAALLVVAFQWITRRPSETDEVDGSSTPESIPAPPSPDTEVGPDSDAPVDPATRMRTRFASTRSALGSRLSELFGGGASDAAYEGLEEALISADVGVAAATQIVTEVKAAAAAAGARDEAAIRRLLADHLRAMLVHDDRSLGRRATGLSVWLVTGVNGTGKTTTIGKLAAIESRQGRAVVLGAADTFRAAAAQQLEVWAQRTKATLIAKDEGADPASVAYEAYDAAAARGADLLIVDTAGRLHNQQALMDELGKVARVLGKQADGIDETLLVLDATTGQNGIAQARAFLQAVNVTGIALTKLDGSSKGGIVVAVQRELGIPVKLVGLGEDIDDLAPFDPDLFVSSLLDLDD